MKHINVIYRSTGVGLDRDALLLKDALQKAGHQCSLSRYKDPKWLVHWLGFKAKYDANIFLERVHSKWISAAKKNYLIPNQERFPKRHLKKLKKITTILCKTKHAEEIFSQLGFPTEYIGFSSLNRNLESESGDPMKFLHLAGKSTLKGTDDILKLWANHPEWPELTLVQHQSNAPKEVPRNVKLISKFLADKELQTLQNSHGVHLCLSRSEGWGHYIVEAISCGATVVATDAPPMNELVTGEIGVLVPYDRSEPRHLGTNFFFSETALETQINLMVQGGQKKQSEEERRQKQEHYEKIHQLFYENIGRIDF